MSLTPTSAIAVWQRALASEIGIAITCADRAQMRPFLYQARKKVSASQPELMNLIMILPPVDNELWICKKEVELDE